MRILVPGPLEFIRMPPANRPNSPLPSRNSALPSRDRQGAVPALKALTILSLTLLSLHAQQSQKRLVRRICGLVLALVWPENPIRRIPSSTKGCISVRNFGMCEPASAPETPRITQETPEPGTRRIAPVCQPFMADASVAAVMTAWLDRAGEVGHCWFIQPARQISRKRNVQAL